MVALQKQVSDLSASFYKNNFTSTQTFNKASVFIDRLKIPVFASAPTVAEIGDIFSSTTGKFYICTTASVGGSGAVWTVAGTQS